MRMINQLFETSSDPLLFEGGSYTDAPDEYLLFASRSGDHNAFAELCNRHNHILRKKILRIVRHREDAEDVLQDSLLKAFLHLDRFRGACKFQTWLIRIGVNASLMLLRKRRSRSRFMVDSVGDDGVYGFESWFPDAGPNPEQEYVRAQLCALITQSVGRLREDFRCLLEDHYGQGHSVAELAANRGISTATAKARMHRARRLLRERMKHKLDKSCCR